MTTAGLEGPRALSAGVWPRPAALALGGLRAVVGEEALVTPGALGRPLPLVREVGAQRGLPVVDAHVTVRTRQDALPCMCGQMSQQILLQAEAPPTFEISEALLAPRGAPLMLRISVFAQFLPGPARLLLQVASAVLL